MVLDDKHVCVCSNLYKNYVDSCSGDKDAVSELSFKRCVREVFGISPVKTHSNNKALTIYKGLKYAEESKNFTENTDLSIIFNALPMDWYWVKVCDEFRCAAMKTGIFVQNTEIVKEVNVFADGSITIFLGNISIDPITIGLPKHVKDSTISMWDYLQLVGKCKVCLGKETTKTYKGCHVYHLVVKDFCQ